MTSSNEYVRNLRARRRAAGQCVNCMATTSGWLCQACARAESEARNERAARDGGAARDRNRARARASQQELRDKRHAAGLCVHCETPTADGKWRCADCSKHEALTYAAKSKAKHNAVRAQLLAAGLCTACESPAGGKWFCAECAAHRANRKRERELRKEAAEQLSRRGWSVSRGGEHGG